MRSSIDVHNLLRERDIPHEIIPMTHPINSAEMMAGVLNLPKKGVFASHLYFFDDEPVILMLPAGCTACEEKLAKVISASLIRPANEDEASEATGYINGSIPPVAHHLQIRVVMDETLSGEVVLYTAAGDRFTILKIKLTDLLKVTSALMADISKA
ncbi:MAG: YbaK/EbsC family protein [Actinomycetota bacterium]|nr:YbaK/EbsC family protein [Actinomycetota bacterium]